MASVNTHMSSAPASRAAVSTTCACNVGYLRSADGVLSIVELVSGFLVWALISDTAFSHFSEYIWVMVVALLCWILTALLFMVETAALHRFIPNFRLVVLVVDAVSSVLYLTAFITNAACVSLRQKHVVNNWAASSFFAALATVSYVLSALLDFATVRDISIPFARPAGS